MAALSSGLEGSVAARRRVGRAPRPADLRDVAGDGRGAARGGAAAPRDGDRRPPQLPARSLDRIGCVQKWPP